MNGGDYHEDSEGEKNKKIIEKFLDTMESPGSVEIHNYDSVVSCER